MYLILILIEINNDYILLIYNIVTCSHPLLFNFIRWHHASGWEQLIHATHPMQLWSVGKSTFLHDCVFI